MTINKKIFLLFSALFITLLSLIYFILKDRESSALEFENQVVKNKVNNLHNILMNKKKLLDNITYEYSTNESIIKLINDKNKKDIFYDFSSKLDVSYFLILDNNKEIIYSEAYDINSKEYVDISNSISDFFSESNLSSYINNEEFKFMTFDYERLIFSLERIDKTGYVFTARTLDSTFLSESSSMLDSYISFLPSYSFNNKDVIRDKFKSDTFLSVPTTLWFKPIAHILINPLERPIISAAFSISFSGTPVIFEACFQVVPKIIFL